MARTFRDANLETRTARFRLAIRAEPYWRTVDPGAHLGYYRGKRGGSWVARLYQEGRYRKTALGTADDMSDADGVAIVSFAQAQVAARNWFAKLARESTGIEPAAAGPYHVRDALSDYLADYKRRGGKALAATQVAADAHILPTGTRATTARSGLQGRSHLARRFLSRASPHLCVPSGHGGGAVAGSSSKSRSC
jgi:hypothetical protein